MTALGANANLPKEERWSFKQFTLKSGLIAYQGYALFMESSSQKLILTPTEFFVGWATEKVDASAGDKLINVDLNNELVLRWLNNGSSTNAVAATDLGKEVYWLDASTITILPGTTVAGRVWAYDSTKGVLTEIYRKSTDIDTVGASPATFTYTSNNYSPASLVNGSIFDVATTGAASTITLPAAAVDGTVVYFAADGTKNGHAVTYRDATGTVALTTALTASKRHLVIAAKRGGIWVANAYVSP